MPVAPEGSTAWCADPSQTIQRPGSGSFTLGIYPFPFSVNQRKLCPFPKSNSFIHETTPVYDLTDSTHEWQVLGLRLRVKFREGNERVVFLSPR